MRREEEDYQEIRGKRQPLQQVKNPFPLLLNAQQAALFHLKLNKRSLIQSLIIL